MAVFSGDEVCGFEEDGGAVGKGEGGPGGFGGEGEGYGGGDFGGGGVGIGCYGGGVVGGIELTEGTAVGGGDLEREKGSLGAC